MIRSNAMRCFGQSEKSVISSGVSDAATDGVGGAGGALATIDKLLLGPLDPRDVPVDCGLRSPHWHQFVTHRADDDDKLPVKMERRVPETVEFVD